MHVISVRGKTERKELIPGDLTIHNCFELILCGISDFIKILCTPMSFSFHNRMDMFLIG